MVILALFALACVGQRVGDKPAAATDSTTSADSGPTTDSGDTVDSTDSARDTALPDADGDGYPDAAAGGTDCDDADPNLNPGATELCDEKDWNCDGDPYDNGACSNPQDLGLLAEGTWDGYVDAGTHDVWWGCFAGDLDGDGYDDLTLAGPNFTPESDYGSVYFVRGGQPITTGMHSSAAASASWHGNAGYSALLGSAFPAGDVDGDGYPDLWLPASDYTGILGLALGPPSRWGLNEDVTAADVVWFGEAYRDGFPNNWHPATDVDLNSDGRSDGVFFSNGVDTGPGALYLLYGGPDISSVQDRSAGDSTKIPCAGIFDVAVGDITGDGLPDIVVGGDGADGAVRDVLLDGLDLSNADGADCDALAWTIVDPGSPADMGVAVIGDWDGDGYQDWATDVGTASVDYLHEGQISLISGSSTDLAATASEEDSLVFASFLGGMDQGFLGGDYPRSVADLNGDGLPELATALGGDALVIPSGGYAGVDLPLPAATLNLQGADAEGVELSGVLGDFDGDGVQDVLVGGADWNHPIGREYLWLGGEIPWNDPEAW